MTPKQLYILQTLQAYRLTPQTTLPSSRSSRQLAASLFDQGVPLQTVQSAMLLVAVRRLFRPPQAAPLPPIRTLHYFLPVIEEIMLNPLPHDYVLYLRTKLHRLS